MYFSQPKNLDSYNPDRTGSYIEEVLEDKNASVSRKMDESKVFIIRIEGYYFVYDVCSSKKL